MVNTKPIQAPGSCPECEIGPFTRNHYFTGKLLVERDFRQEQDYYVDKLRLHARQLSGAGVVCGLKVTQHDNPACRDRFVCVEPGFAIDCCGHDILVAEKDCLDITSIPAVKKLLDAKDGKPHTLQICIRYKECPSEPIPVLYDDCGCDDTQCAPNRILESYQLDVMVDQPVSAESPDQPGLSWTASINIAHAAQVVLSEGTQKLYVVTDDNPGFVYQVSAGNSAILTSHALGRHALAMAVSNAGDRVYVVTEGAAAGDQRQLHVLDSTQAGLPLIQAAPLDIPATAGSGLLLAVLPAPDGRLIAVVESSGDLLRWATDINTATAPAPPTKLGTLGANQNSMALSSDGAALYVADSAKIQKFVLSTSTATTIGGLPAGAVPSSLAVIAASSGDLLAVADQTNKKLSLVNPASGSLTGSAALAHPPVAMAIASDGRWAYVVEQEAGASYLEPLDIGSLQLGQPVLPAAVLPIGAGSRVPVLNSSGTTLFVPYTGNLANANDGGVAVITVTESACCGLIWKSLDGCPTCDTADCLTLATIIGYVAGDAIEDLPADSKDTANNIARIDNHTRKLLPSTSTLAEIVECLCKSGSGGQGLAGKQGDQGPAGLGIDKVAAQFVACDQPGSAAIAMVGADRTLELVIPGACNHDFAHINAISWIRNGASVNQGRLMEQGLVIAFDREITAADVTQPGAVQILGPSAARSLTCWCELQLKLLHAVNVKFSAVNPNGTATIDMGSITNPTAANPANAIHVILSTIPPPVQGQQARILRVVVNGDFISSKDSKGVIRGADVDHLPGWLPNRLTGDGIEGGVFVSWLQVEG